MTSPCYPTDFSPLFRGRKPSPNKRPHVAIIVTSNGHNKELPYAGIVAVDGKALIHTDLDDLGVGSFISEAIARVTAAMPTAHIQSTIEMYGPGLVATGVVVPCPPRPPRYEVSIEGMHQVFKLQHEVLERTFKEQVPQKVPLPQKVPVPQKVPGPVATHVVAQKAAKTPVGKAAAVKSSSAPRKT